MIGNVSHDSQWNTVKVLARKMGHIARLHYNNNRRITILHDGQEKPVISYILYSYLIQAKVCREAGNFEEALNFISLYEYPDWIIAPSEQEQIIISQFKDWAKANRYLYRMMSGYSEAVEEYVNYIKTRKDEIFAALCNVVVAANRHHFNIDHILEQFSKYQTYNPQKNQLGKISEHVTISRYNRLLSELGIYYLNSKQYDSGLSYILDSLEYSIRIKSDNGMLRCMGIFEQFRHSSSEDILKRYDKLIREVQKLSVYAWSPQV
ncbi:hypothetical protein [Paenibacillus solani]|uniref:hypothetical protein n=1 Tax=Paenibacillus solani TaxID=1705565 RepID=UPI0006C854CA|nr:hypothetical protein [Paenibacillus solani]